MSLLTQAELAAFAGVEAGHPRLEAAAESAEALVAAWLGTASLTARQVTCEIVPPRRRRLLELPEGPLSALSSVEVDGAALAPEGFTARPWAVSRASGFRAGVPVTLSWQSGWGDGPGEVPLPDAIRQALRLVAGSLLGRGADLSREEERLGDQQVTRRLQGQGLPGEARLLLRPWRKP
ncbi:hypothetical protein ACFOW6_15945 [Fodinicurvata halophila]|uniref:PhiE125 gp8 family phage protein n=2 Tax=Fodinicurvata halophila TaxID=1419723 RepID=A0ABV8UR23_9PROT